jgi:cytochrome P450
MSATKTRPSARSDAAPTPVAKGGLANASLPESVAVLLTGVVPALARGLFSPRPGAMRLLTAINSDRRAITVLKKVRRKHAGQGVRLLGGRIVVLWGAEAIGEVLDHSAEIYASDGGAKAKGMSHFQPDALTLSRGEEWEDRRRFTEAVLATEQRIHPFARRFLRVVAEEIDALSLGSRLTYRDWERAFDRITLRVVFGDDARDDQHITELLEKLMGESNRLVGLKRSDEYYELYRELERHVAKPGNESLVACFAEAPHSDRTRMTQQIPHWMFALRDTLAANCFRALAAIVSDSQVERRVRDELSGADLRDPQAIDRMRYLEGVLHEAMRLWPTTPLLARETTNQTELAGERLDEGVQVMMLNVFNHRAPAGVDEPGRIKPERWEHGEKDYRFNHLSNGTQDCPGGPLVLLLGKAAIAQTLNARSVKLRSPKLGGGGELPEMLDFFRIELALERS